MIEKTQKEKCLKHGIPILAASHLAFMERRITCNRNVFPGPRREGSSHATRFEPRLIWSGQGPTQQSSLGRHVQAKHPMPSPLACINRQTLLQLNPTTSRRFSSGWAGHGLSSATSTPLQGTYLHHRPLKTRESILPLIRSLIWLCNLTDHGLILLFALLQAQPDPDIPAVSEHLQPAVTAEL